VNELRALIERHASTMWRYRWVGVAAAWLLCLGGWAAIKFIPSQYEATARVYVDADAVLTPLLRGLALDNSPTNQLEVMQRTLLSRPNLGKLISKTNLDLSVTGPAQQEALITRLGTEIRINPQTRNLFTISYRNPSAQLAYDVVQNILNLFIEDKAGTSRSDMENAQQFMQGQIASYEQQLRKAEAKRAEFRTRYVDLLPDANSGSSRLDAARSSAQALQGRLTDAIAKRDSLQRELPTTPPMLVTETEPGTGTAAADGGLAEARAQLRELRLRLTDKHPDVVLAQQRVAMLESKGGASSGAPAGAAPHAAGPRSRSQPNPLYEQLKVRLLDAEAEVTSLQRQTADAVAERERLETIARSVPGVQAEYINLDRDYDVIRKSYDDLLARREQMRLSAAADSSAEKVKVQIVDPPQVPQNPVAPNRALLLSGVLVAGLAGGVGLIFLLSQLDQSFHTAQDLRDLGLPIAGVISLVGAVVPFSRRVFQVCTVALAVLLLCLVYSGLLYRLLKSTGSA
jgi:polysaccharide chain length determinant protein (PEP-CTERM system associated)